MELTFVFMTQKVCADAFDLDINSRSTEDKKALTSCSDPYSATIVPAVAIITEWDEFIEYDWKIYFNLIKPAKLIKKYIKQKGS